MRAAPFFLFLMAGLPAAGQDLRNVSEPAVPPACTVLRAAVGRAGSSIVPEDETKLDTLRIQAALDGCKPGQAVVLRRSSSRLDSFLSGPLQLRRGIALVVDKGAYLFASRNPRDYDVRPGVCGTIDAHGGGCKALINGDGVADAAVMGDGVIDGRGGETMLGQNLTWWNLADKARKGGTQNNPRLIELRRCDNFTLYRITIMNSPQHHVVYDEGTGFTAWSVKVWSPERARNADGINPGRAKNVTISYCYIHTGDDQVAIKAAAGRPTSNISIVHNHFYTGHGMSIGSETQGGANAIRVSDLSIDGSDNGLRIKSNPTRGGLVRDVVYEDVCIRGTANPVVMETSYSAHVSKAGNLPPVYRDITIRDVRVQDGGTVKLEGLDAEHRLGIRFDNVVFDKPEQTKVTASHAGIIAGPGPFNLKVSGPDVEISGQPGSKPPNACAGKFEAFPLQ